MSSISLPIGSITYNQPTGTISNPVFGSITPGSLDLNFMSDTGLSQLITFTRSTVANRYNASGILEQEAINVARANSEQDYNPSTLAPRGFLIEESRTNSIRNNTMVGAAAGSPGTPPTNWTFTVNGVTGLTTSLTAVGAEDGIEYVEYQVTGTPSAAGNIDFIFESDTQIVASSGQTWASSVYTRLTGGSFSGVSSTNIRIKENTSGGALVLGTNIPISTPTSAELRTQRQSVALLLSGGGTVARINTLLRLATSGAALNFTLRVGLPQLEQGAFATSVIKTSTVAVQRTADNASITNLSTIGFSATQGSMYAEFMLEGVGSTTNRRVLSLNDNTGNNALEIVFFDNAGDTIRFAITVSASTSLVTSGVVGTANTVIKAAVSWAANSFRIACNGTAGTELTSGALPVVTQLDIGRLAASAYLGGWLRTAAYFPQQLTTAQLQAMTA